MSASFDSPPTRVHDYAMDRVNIIGAGIGGLTLAHALVKAGIDVRIYERDAEIDARPQGFIITLQDYGLAALRECLPGRSYDLIHATASELRGPGLLFDHNLNLLSSELEHQKSGVDVDRSLLRDILLLGLADRTHFGKRLTGFTDGLGATVRAHFADGASADADLLVGADGGNSAVRRGLLPHISLTESGITGAVGQIRTTAQWQELLPGRVMMVRGPGLNFMIARMEFPLRLAESLAEVRLARPAGPPESYLSWALLVPPDQEIPPTVGAAKVRELVADLIKDWHPALVDLVRSSDRAAPSSRQVLDRPIEPWRANRVTLLGDAAHLALPIGGYGANTAFVDAVCLRNTLLGEGDLTGYMHDLIRRGNDALKAVKGHVKDVIPDGD